MLENARVTAFTISELLETNQQAGKITPLPDKDLNTHEINKKFFWFLLLRNVTYKILFCAGSQVKNTN